MPSQVESIQAIMVLKDLTDTEIAWLTKFADNPCSVTGAEMISHANIIKVLLGAHTDLNYIMMRQMVAIDDTVAKIQVKLAE